MARVSTLPDALFCQSSLGNHEGGRALGCYGLNLLVSTGRDFEYDIAFYIPLELGIARDLSQSYGVLDVLDAIYFYREGFQVPISNSRVLRTGTCT